MLVLDEPFSGLDPVAVDALSKVLVGRGPPGRHGAVLVAPARPRRGPVRAGRRRRPRPGRRRGHDRRADRRRRSRSWRSTSRPIPTGRGPAELDGDRRRDQHQQRAGAPGAARRRRRAGRAGPAGARRGPARRARQPLRASSGAASPRCSSTTVGRPVDEDTSGRPMSRRRDRRRRRSSPEREIRRGRRGRRAFRVTL